MTSTEDQQLLEEAAREFFAEKSPVRNLRENRSAGRPYEPALWAEISALGFAGALVPERLGGSGIGYRGMGLVLEAAGRTLSASPLFQTGLVGAAAFLIAGSEAQRAEVLPSIARGDITLALAVDEGAHHQPARLATRAERVGDEWIVTGSKRFVPDGATADALIVAVRTAGDAAASAGVTLLHVDAATLGLSREPRCMIDSRGFADVTFHGARVPVSRTLGPANEAEPILERILDIARIGLAAEMLGAAQAVFDATLEYLKTRMQFGRPIGSFQALQHRAAKMYVELELSRSCVAAALDALDGQAPDIRQLASLAKARMAETLHHVSNEAVQMHGAIGMTDEHDAGLYLKRARVQEALYGSAAFHRHRSAALAGF